MGSQSIEPIADLSNETAPAAVEPQPEKQSLSLFLGVLLGIATVLALFFRWHGLGSRSLWWDEGFTEWVSQFSFSGLYRALQTDSGPPLFYVLQHYWIKCFGL